MSKKEVNKVVKFYSTGKRKRSIAKVYLYESDQPSIMINKKELNSYFTYPSNRLTVLRSIEACDLSNVSVCCTVYGGGLSGQADAVSLGIAKAITLMDEKFKDILKALGLLTRDARKVQRKIVGHKKARKKEQYSKR